MNEETHDLATLEGEDVCVCTINAEAIQQAGAKIFAAHASVVIVCFDPGMPAAKDNASNIVQQLKLLYTPRLKLRIECMSIDDWDEYYEKIKGGHFGLKHILLDKGVRKPKSYESFSVCGELEKALSDFDDIPETKNRLLDVVRIFARPFDGMWPVLLLLGDSGSGKSFAARKIHYALKRLVNNKGGEAGRGEGGGRTKDDFVSLNCGEFGTNDINGALFGIKGGRFSGVDKDQPGAIDAADGGVLFLDEIGELPIELQSRLLTVLDTGEYRMHGDNKATKKANCRFVFGTNKDIEEAIRNKQFRYDLYCRIKGITVRMPTVKDRIAGQNADMFLDNAIDSLCKGRCGLVLTRRARELFKDFAKKHEWSGNFRELGRFFNLLLNETMSGVRRNDVSAAVMDVVIEKFCTEVADSEGCETVASNADYALHPLLSCVKNVYAKDKVVLDFAFRCAADSRTSAEAARRFYDGRRIQNPQDSYDKFLGRFGFAYDLEAVGHVRQIDN